ncbi:MAG: Tim44/TimA family putative adaptor protein, partial [Hyphomonadaceae bacterium]
TRAGEPAPAPAPAAAAAGDGFSEIARADPSFDNARFLAGARSAYELIVDAYAKGDRDQLKPLLTPRVYEAYAAAIAERQAKGEAGPELVRLRAAELSDATLENNIARVSVQFEAELAEGLHHMRETRERWTFERDVRSQDPNWRLARVVQA